MLFPPHWERLVVFLQLLSLKLCQIQPSVFLVQDTGVGESASIATCLALCKQQAKPRRTQLAFSSTRCCVSPTHLPFFLISWSYNFLIFLGTIPKEKPKCMTRHCPNFSFLHGRFPKDCVSGVIFSLLLVKSTESHQTWRSCRNITLSEGKCAVSLQFHLGPPRARRSGPRELYAGGLSY